MSSRVEIHIERGTAVVVYPQTEALLGPIERLRYERGPVRLIVSMTAPRILSRRVATLGLAASVLGLVVSLASLHLADALPVLVLMLVVAFFSVRALLRPDVCEQLAIDSRLVSVAYDSDLSALFGRQQLANIRVASDSEKRPGGLGSQRRIWPRIVWGDEGFGVGSSLSVDEADRVLAAIEAFCRDNPPDPSFEFTGSYMPESSSARI